MTPDATPSPDDPPARPPAGAAARDAERDDGRVPLLGYRLDPLTLPAAAERTLALLRRHTPSLVVTLNPEIIVQAEDDPRLAEALRSAALTVADGVGVLWAARRFGRPLPERVPGVELVEEVLERGGPALSVFFLGARPGVAERAAQAAARRYGVRVAGTHHGFFRRPDEVPEVVATVAASGAQLLLAGLGPGQERFLAENLDALGVTVAIGVGGTLDVLAGEVERTPAWTRRWGLEWAYRVGSDPRRWHRAPRLLRFVRLVLAARLRGR